MTEAKADDALSAQTINATWAGLDQATKSRLLDAEHAWIRNKVATCNVQAAASSTDPSVVEATRLRCDASANQQRTEWLKQYLPGQSQDLASPPQRNPAASAGPRNDYRQPGSDGTQAASAQWDSEFYNSCGPSAIQSGASLQFARQYCRCVVNQLNLMMSAQQKFRLTAQSPQLMQAEATCRQQG